MKKILSLLLTAAMTFSLLTGCSGGGGGGPAQPAGKTELSPEATSASCGGVTVDVGDFVLDEAAELTVAKQATEENKEEGYKIESYDISIGDLQQLDDFITIRIPYDETYCDSGQDPARCVGAKYKNESTGEWEDVLFEVDAQAKELVIYTDHLSIYGAFYVENEGKRNAYITDVLSSGLVMSREQAVEFGNRIKADDPSVKSDLCQFVDKANNFLFDYADRIDNTINFVTLGDVPEWLDTTIPDTNTTLFTALGYVATCYNLLDLARKETVGGGVETGEALNLIRDVGSKVTTYWADSFTAVGSGALAAGMGAAFIIDKMLTAFAEEAHATKMEDIAYVYHHFNESFNGFGHKVMTAKDWRAKVIQVVDAHPDNPELAISALEAGFTKYASEFFNLTGDQMYEVASDVPNITIKGIPNITESEKSQLMDDYIAHLKDTTMPAVLTSVQNYMIKKVEQQELAAINKIKEYYNSKITITLKEEIPEGQATQFKDYKFRFAPLSEGAVKNSWTGKWPENGEIRSSATLMGFMIAGFPHTVEFFKPDADMEKDAPEFTIPFVISIPSIDIKVSGKEPLSIDAFMGEWVNTDGERTILIRNGNNVIEKNPDLSWYGGSVSCTEYSAEYDTASDMLILTGLTTWLEEPDTLYVITSADQHDLEMDASSASQEYWATEVKDGVLTVMEDNAYYYNRQ